MGAKPRVRQEGQHDEHRDYSVEVITVGTPEQQEAIRQNAIKWLANRVLPRVLQEGKEEGASS